MFAIIGIVVVIASVFGGYVGAGGYLSTLWMPLEYVIIFGAGIGAFFISSSKPVLGGSGKALGMVFKGPKYKRENYLELLGVLYSVFKLAKSKGDLALESHVENPNESDLFQKFPLFLGDHHAVEFTCDYLRLLTLGTNNSFELEAIMDQELEVHHTEHHDITSALQTLADGLPALGIVAAVLGIIKTMGSISEPPEVLGELIAGALVGTFSGILMSYGFMAPLAGAVGANFSADGHYLTCIKSAIIAHVQGYAPQVSIEFARKTLSCDTRPTFLEVEEMVGEL